MSDRTLQPWPRFDLVPVSGADLPPPWAERYPTLHVPGEAAVCRYRSVALRLVTLSDGRELLQFGEHPFTALCLDPADGQVVDLVVRTGGAIVRGPRLVNSSLEQYVATVREATARFPFDDGSGEDLDYDRAADSLRAHLRPIDPAAWEIDGHWDSFYWDITMGDWASYLFQQP